ncbi:MAG: PEP-CTERM sorting domain-containing protein [Planctomycetales bacterium]|nr:PEP-CTERM sorting domain-containing protein [Planctomycetales bacterium]
MLKRNANWLRGICATLIGIALASPTLAAPNVVNGDFETGIDAFTVWPGYTGGGNPEQIEGWIGEGGRGINPISTGEAPFRDNGGNDTHVALLQGDAYIEQSVGGFTVGSDYTLSLDFNARNCCGDMPIGTITLNGINAGSTVDLFPPPGGIIPVGDTNDWYHADIDFTAPTEDIVLRITTTSATGGDSTMLVDNVSFRAVPEPGSATLMLLGLLGFAARSRR